MTKKTWTYEELEAGVLEIIRSQKQFDESLTAQTDLAAAGLDSLTMVRVMVAIEEKFGIWLEGDTMSYETLRTVEMMAQSLHKVIAQEASA
ncbi:MAG TPA: phosphopantetheine-binding protein [Candidatus Methylacidiphilales bacterium]|nr:phosphopantetheine-binding protein [Candidatus Methylacidiphilales bacterium]